MFKRDQVLLQLRQVPDVFLHVLRVFLACAFHTYFHAGSTATNLFNTAFSPLIMISRKRAAIAPRLPVRE